MYRFSIHAVPIVGGQLLSQAYRIILYCTAIFTCNAIISTYFLLDNTFIPLLLLQKVLKSFPSQKQ